MHRLDQASQHFAYIITEMKKYNKNIFDVKLQDELIFLKKQHLMTRPDRAADCTPGYYNNEGVGQDQNNKEKKRLMGIPHVENPLVWFAELKKRRENGTALDCFYFDEERERNGGEGEGESKL